MLTKPRRLSKNHVRGDCRSRCDYCGACFYRSQLVRNESGFLACIVDCAKGRDEVLLNRLNAEHAAQVMKKEPDMDQGSADTNSLPTIVRRTAADITRYLA